MAFTLRYRGDLRCVTAWSTMVLSSSSQLGTTTLRRCSELSVLHALFSVVYLEKEMETKQHMLHQMHSLTIMALVLVCGVTMLNETLT